MRGDRIDEASFAGVSRGSFCIFLCLLSLLSVLRLALVLGRRVPMGHDTFNYLLIQYSLFFNEPALNGDVPRWLPFLTHGVVSNLKLGMSHGLLVSVLLPFIRWTKHINFLPLFQGGLLFDELVLLLGCVLLARDCFRSRASILFVASSVVFTTISSAQICFDFHLVYLLPLILYCMGRALRRASAKYLFFAGLFFVGTLLGNVPYVVTVLAFTIFVFGSVLFFCMPSGSVDVLKHFLLRWRLRHLVSIVVPCLFALCIFLFLRAEIARISSHTVGRTADFAVSDYKTFVSYGGYVNVRKYLEFISRGSNNIDNTIYAGLLVVPFAVLALLRVRSRLACAFGITALIMALFSSGLLVPRLFYHLFPFGKHYRHIGLIAPLVKLFVVFYAGFGFDLLWRSLKDKPLSLGNKANVFIPSVVLLCILVPVFAERFAGVGIFDFSTWKGETMANQ